MPRTPLTSATSAASSSRSSNNSEHFPYRYVDLENVINIFSRRENVATAINLAHNDWTAFTEIAFLDYLIQNIWRKEIQLEKDKRLARALLGSGSRMEDSGLRRRIPKGLGLSLCAVPS
jgi:hypothetical protein